MIEKKDVILSKMSFIPTFEVPSRGNKAFQNASFRNTSFPNKALDMVKEVHHGISRTLRRKTNTCKQTIIKLETQDK